MTVNSKIETSIIFLEEDFLKANIQFLQFKSKNKKIREWKQKKEHLNQLKVILKNRLKSERYFISDDIYNFTLNLISRHGLKFSDEFITQYLDNEVIWSVSDDLFVDSSIISKKNILKRFIVEELYKKGFVVTGKDKFFEQWLDPFTEDVEFEVRDPNEAQHFENVLYYPGYKFRIFFYNNKFAIGVDKSHLILPNRTIRDLSIKEMKIIEEKTRNRGEIKLWDYCPNFNCLKAAEGSCNLSPITHNRSYYFIKFDYKNNAHDYVIHDVNKTVLHYAVDQCETKEINNFISNKPPLVIVKSRLKDNKILHFPPERLRERVEFGNIKRREDRQELMIFMRSTPFERRKDILELMDDLKRFEVFGNYYHFQPFLYNGIKNGIFDILRRQIGDNKNSDDPFNLLYKFGPFDKNTRTIRNLDLIIYKEKAYPAHKYELFIDHLVNGLTNGKISNEKSLNRKKRFHGLKDLFKFSKIKTTEIDEINLIRKTAENQIVIAILDQRSTKKNQIYKKCIEENLGVQCVVHPDQKNKRYQGKLKNLALGIYMKLGCLVWQQNQSFKYYFVGIKPDRTYPKTFSVTIIGSNGEFISNLTEENDNLAMIVEKIKNELNKIGNIETVIHWHGNIDKNEIKTLKNLDPISIILIKDNIKALRVFDNDKANKTPQSGSYVFIDFQNILLVSTTELTRAGTPQPILIESVFPENVELDKKHVRDIFNLTRLNQHVTHGLTKLPVSLHYSSLALEKKKEIKAYPNNWQKIGWFV